MKVIHNTDIEQITFLDERFYLDSKTETYLPSVSTILDVYPKGYGFIQWLKDMGNNADEVLRKAGEQGSRIHAAIENFLNGEEVSWVNAEKDNYNLDEWLMFLRFVDFYKTFKPKTIAVEMSMVDTELGFGGTLDYVCNLNGQVWYIDWKSGNSIYKSNKMQGAAYIKLWNKKSEIKIERAGCMHLRALTRGADKSGKNIQGDGWKLEEATDLEHLYKLFEHTHAIWKEENPNPKPKNMVYPDKMSMKILEKIELEGNNAPKD